MRRKKILLICVCTFILLGGCFFAKKLCFKSQPDLTILGFIHLGDGIGSQSANLIDVFRNEMKISFIATRKQRASHLPEQYHPYIKEKHPEWGKVIIFEDLLWWPNQDKYQKIVNANKDSIRIAYTMWESTRIPNEWVMILNKYFDAVAVPAPFLIDTYRQSGVTIPIFELPLGINLKTMFNQPLKEKCKKPFVFGNLSVCSERKNQILLVKAFAKAFGNNPDVQLRINCRHGEENVSVALTKEISALKLDNVIFTQFKLSDEEYLETFKNIDCYVSPSKGEGFSIQPREAMALGIPVIATKNTGQTVVCESGLVKTIETPIVESAIFPWGNSYGHYYNCDIDDLSLALIEVKENYEEYLKVGSDAREWVKQYQFENVQALYRTLIKPKKVVLGEGNSITPDYLVTNSKSLYEKYHKILNLSSE